MGGEWTINFRTYGTHNLTISVINGTTFGDSSPDDVGFVGVLCGNDSILDATAHDGIITFEDYQCDGIASLVLSVHTPGIHDLQFSFGAGMAYASNNAYPRLSVEINNSTANGPVLSDYDYFGRSVAAIGDLDGDGVQDLAVGADGDDHGGEKRGAVHVMFMNGNGTVKGTVEINDSTANGPVLSDYDYFGVSVAAIGDLDGDGVQDLVVGANGDDHGGENRGAVHVMFMNGNGSVKGTVEINDSTANGPVLSNNDFFGTSVAAIGDLDGDGVQDLAVGADGDDHGGTGRGAVHVMFMNGNGTVKGTVEINDYTANGPVLSNMDNFGRSVAAIGDLDGDGVQDLVVGANGDDHGGENRGAVHVMFMNGNGSVKGTVEINDSTANGPVLSNMDNFGVSVAAIGDLDGDGVQDLAVGADGDSNGGTDHGAVHVMFMNGNGTVKGTVEINDSTANGPVLSNMDNFGVSVAAIGDLDGDGVQDLAVGADGDDHGGENRGAVHIIHINGMKTNGNGSVDNTVEINDSTANSPVLSDYDYFGGSVAAIGDLDGDGVTDLAVGAQGDDDGGEKRGAVHVMFMNGNGSVKGTVEINNSTANGPVLSDDDGFGRSVAAIGDLDGDGVQDLAVGANGDDNGGTDHGAVHVMFMNGNGSVKDTVEINNSTANGPVLSNNDFFGTSVAAIGDLDGDGVPDLAAGANGDSNGGEGRGAVHVMFMNGNGSVKGTVEINDSTANGPVLSDEDYFGASVAAIGDLDGDGVQDLVVGAWGNYNGGPGRGAVHVMFMNGNGTVKGTVEINDSTANGPVLSDEDYFGISVAAIGDLDGDGVQDLAVGADGDDNGGTDHGAVHVMFMNRDGSVKDTVEINDSTANGPVLSDDDFFGASVAAIGDLDGDGVPDLAAGAWGDDHGGTDHGTVHVMFMNGNGSVKDTVKINDSTANSPVLSDYDYFGGSVAAIGDLDGDGVTDLAVGAQGDDDGGEKRGAVHVMFMNGNGSVKGTVEINNSTANGPVLSDDDGFGRSVAAIGDLDGDGVQDLAAGAWGDDNGGTDHGTVHIMYFDKDVLIRAVSSTTADGTYGSSQTVDITVKFSEPVAVTGTPRLTLDVSPQHRTAPYLSGSGTDILTFRYAPQSTDVSSDLQYVAQNSLSPDGEMGGATITALKSPGRDVIPLLPDPAVMFDFNPPGAFGSLAQNKNIEIFTVPNQPPTISSITGNTTINEGASGTLTGIASDSDGNISSYLWSVDDTSTITITTGDAAILRYTASQVSSDTQVTFTLTVTDDDGATASATYDVTVNNVPVPNQSPTISSITGDTTINEGTSGTLTGTASDSDGTISTYAWSVDDTSVITITSGNAATLQYTASQVSSDTQVTFTLTVTDDDGATASATYDVTVNNVPVPNQSPTISSITGDTTINEGASGTLTGTASDSDGTISTYAWSVDDTSVITITSGNAATLQYTASQVSSDTQVTFTLTVTDDDGATASATYDVTVNNVPVPNQSPTISSITGDTTINEGASGTLTGIASDSDGTISSYLWSVNDTSTITITTGDAAILQYTASQVSSNTQVTFTLTVTDDDGATASATYDVTVNNVPVPNQSPTISSITGDTTINEGASGTLTGTASDSDGTISTYAWSVDDTSVITITSGNAATLQYTASQVSSDTQVTFTLTVTDDDGATASATYDVTVNNVPVPNQSPTISSITGDTTINEGASGTLTGIASDSDGTISSYLWSVNDTSTITITTGDAAILQYTASQVSSNTQVTFTLTVTDDDGATASATYDVTVNNVPVPNQSPTISSITGDTTINEGASGTLTGTASDSDGTISTYAWSVDDTSVITITSGNAATLQYTASQVSSDTQVTFTLTVTDDDGATASATYDVTVNNVPVPNQSPTISSITGDTTINEGASGTLTGIASDSDGTISSYLWSVNDTSTITITTGDAAILQYTASQVSSNTQVTFTLTVTDDDGATAFDTYDVTVTDVSVPTVTDTTPPRVASILRGTPLAQSTTDTTLVFAVTFDEPVTNVDDADFTVTGSGTGTISGVSGSGTSYRVTVTVTTSGTIGLDIAQNHDIQDTATNGLIDLTVIGSNETYIVNQLPVLNNISPQTGDELTLLTFTAKATDPDDNDTRTYSLIEPIPDGATMDTNTGVFSWTPTEAQDGRHTITVQVSDGNGGTDSQNVTITVTEVNQNPRLDPIGAQTIDETDTLRFTATAHDVDIYQGSPNSLRFSLDGDIPRGASITREGSFSWRPDQSQDGVHSINVTVSDGNGGTASEPVSVTVNDIAPRLVSVRGSGSSITLTFSEPVKINGAGLNGFTVSSSSGSTVTVESITGNGTNTLTLLLDGSLSRGDTLSYDSGTGDVADESGKPLESFVDAAILLKSKKSGTAPPPSVDTLEINGQSYNVQNRVNHHPTPLEVAVDQPISMSFTAHDRLDILYFAVYLNLQDDDISYTNSDTYVEYNRGKTNIVDPHNLFSDASITISADPDDRNKKTVALDITFADAIGNTNMVIRTWNADQKSSIVIITDVLNVIHLQVDPEPQVTGVDPEPQVTGVDPEPQVTGVDPEPQVTGVDPEPQVTGVDPEPQLPAVPNPEPGTETFADDFDYDRALLVLRMWSGFESEIADDNQLLAVMGLTHMGTDIPAWVMTDLAPLVVKGLITLDEFRVALEYVMGNNT